MRPNRAVNASWERHGTAWRDPAGVASLSDLGATDPQLLAHRVTGNFWEALAETGCGLMVSREYEHLLLALRPGKRRPEVTYLPLPHPSGIAVDARRGVVHVACTRNPNQIVDLQPVNNLLTRADLATTPSARPLIPVRSRLFPGALYLHDLAMIGGALHGNAVGLNAVVRFGEQDGFTPVWWPKSIERDGVPTFGRNFLQLNSIAAGKDLKSSFFTASAAAPGHRRPGQLNFPVDGRGVLFAGETRESVAGGLTRPHSARLHRGRVWVDDSGYGAVKVLDRGRFETVGVLPGWTRGLAISGHRAFVATSRVIPRFARYAPGLEVDRSLCGVHVVDLTSGRVEGSIQWDTGNQIFGVELLPPALAKGLPFRVGMRTHQAQTLFYAFSTLAKEKTKS